MVPCQESTTTTLAKYIEYVIETAKVSDSPVLVRDLMKTWGISTDTSGWTALIQELDKALNRLISDILKIKDDEQEKLQEMSEKLGIKFANAEPLTGSAVAFEVCVKAGKFIYDEMDEKRLKETKEWIENNTNLLEETKKAEPETRYIPGTEQF